MDSEILKAVQEAIKDANTFDWFAYLMVIGIAVLSSFFGSLFRKMGENVATKKDIAKITDEIEKVKQKYSEQLQNLSYQNQLIIEQGSRRHQLRMAALEKRLEAHQKAYALCHELIANVFKDKDDEEKIRILKECRTWWTGNCLYLDAESRQAFVVAFLNAERHTELVEKEDIMKNWQGIIDPLELLAKGVELPPIAADKLDIPKDNEVS